MSFESVQCVTQFNCHFEIRNRHKRISHGAGFIAAFSAIFFGSLINHANWQLNNLPFYFPRQILSKFNFEKTFLVNANNYFVCRFKAFVRSIWAALVKINFSLQGREPNDLDIIIKFCKTKFQLISRAFFCAFFRYLIFHF